MAQIAYLPIAMFDYCTWGSNTNIHTVCEGLEHQIETYVVEIGLLPSRKLTARSVPNGFSWVFHIYPPVSSNISGWEILEIPEMEVYSCKNSRTVIPHVFFHFACLVPSPSHNSDHRKGCWLGAWDYQVTPRRHPWHPPCLASAVAAAANVASSLENHPLVGLV